MNIKQYVFYFSTSAAKLNNGITGLQNSPETHMTTQQINRYLVKSDNSMIVKRDTDGFKLTDLLDANWYTGLQKVVTIDAIEYAVLNNKSWMLQLLLSYKQTNVNHQNSNGYTLVSMAAFRGFNDILQILINQGGAGIKGVGWHK